MAMNTLWALLHAIGVKGSERSKTQTISKICYNSQHCIQDSIFFAFPGLHTQGSYYIDEAISKGAVCIFSTETVSQKQEGVTYVVSEQIRTTFSTLCAAFYDWPSRDLAIIGVTGTDGKSTTCDYLYQILTSQGCKVGLLGTVSMDDGSGKQPSPYRQSTPEADQLHAFLNRCRDHKVEYVILECTSHALSKEHDRLATIEFTQALLTTLSSEHLEFHKTQDAYIHAKCNLIRALKTGGSFFTTEQNSALQQCSEALPPLCRSYILQQSLPFTTSCENMAGVTLHIQGQTVQTSLALPCLLSNAMLALLAASELLNKEAMALVGVLASLQQVAGRMISIENKLNLRIIIDFAHTADAYQQLFSFMYKTKGKGRIIALFGSAGERDTLKRGQMGLIAHPYADKIILTEEDPRFEPNATIFKDIRSLMPEQGPVIEEYAERNVAIQRAFALAEQGDTLLFLGKGHESTIEDRGKKRPWNEEAQVRLALQHKERT